MIGNFIADFVKGQKALNTFSPEIILGVELHRAIDAFTDNHSIVKQSKARLSPKYRHYSGVVVDMFYDHFLAARWHEYHPDTLQTYSETIYKTLYEHLAILPTRAQHMLPYMASNNWLVNYGTETGLHKALSGMAKRTPYESKMEQAVPDLKIHYHMYEEEFIQFFPVLKKYSDDWLIEKMENKIIS
jgi:acyl carrier protein phosphodiesterase